MRVTQVVSACVLVEHQGTRLLCDPWLTDGIYGGAWHHWPPLQVRPEDFSSVDAIFVSHVHLDHCDPATLARLPKTIPVYIGSYIEPFLARNIRALGFTVHEVAPDQSAQIGALTLQVVPADNCDPKVCGRWIGCAVKDVPNRSGQIDSLAVITGGGKRILNVNDCPFMLAHQALSRVLKDGPIDLLLTGYAGAGPYPQCFAMPVEQKRAAAEAKQQQFLRQMDAFVHYVQPRWYIPFAGQYVLGGSLFDLNEFRGVPDLDDLPHDARMVRLNRNGYLDLETQAATPWKPERIDWEAAREALAGKVLDHEADAWPSFNELAALFEQAQEAVWRRCRERGFSSDWSVNAVAHAAPERWGYQTVLSFQPKHGNTKRLTIEADARLWRRILTKQPGYSMNNCEIGSLLRFSRSPDEFDNPSLTALAYLHV